MGYPRQPGDFPGDHSLVWIDISYDTALGHYPPTPVPPAARRLQLSNSKATEKYLNLYEELIVQHQLPARQRRLQQSVVPGHPLTRFQREEAQAIDSIKTKCMLQAEKKCRKLRMGAVQFSTATELPRNQIGFWNLAIRRRLGIKVSSRLWRRRKKKANITESTSTIDIKGLRQKLKEAKQAYRKAKKEHRQHRKKFLETFSPKDRDRIKRVEEQRQLGRLVK